MKQFFTLLLISITSCLIAVPLTAASGRKEFLMENSTPMITTEQARHREELSEEEEGDDDESDDRSEVSTEIDFIPNDEEETIYQGESSSAALLQPKRNGTVPGDDQLSLDLAALTSYVLSKQEELERLKEDQANNPKKIQQRILLEKEIEIISRAMGYFEPVEYPREKDDDLVFYRRSAAKACLEWQRTKQAKGSALVTECFQQAFDYFEQAIELKQEVVRSQVEDSLDHLITKSLFSLGVAYFREAQARENQAEYKVFRLCEEARKAFEGVQSVVIGAQQYQDRLIDKQKEGRKGLQQLLTLAEQMKDLAIINANAKQELGNELLARVPNKKSLW